MKDLKIILNVDYSKNEVQIICETDSHFNRTWRFKDNSEVENHCKEALDYSKEIIHKLNK